MFEVKKRAFFTPYKTRSTNFEYSWFKAFAQHKVEAFDVVLGNWIKNPQKILKTKKYLFSFFKGSSSRKRYGIIGKC
jgi:hypothetical protein